MTVEADITVHPDGSGSVHLAGRIYPLAEGDEQTARHVGVGLVIAHAQRTGQPIRLTAHDRHTDHQLLITADGDVLPEAPLSRHAAVTDLGRTTAAVQLLEPPSIVQPAAPRSGRGRALLVGGLVVAAGGAALAGIALRPSHDQAGTLTAPVQPAAVDLPYAALGVFAAVPASPAERLRIPPATAARRWDPAAGWQARAQAKAKAAARRKQAANRPQYQPPAQQPAAQTPQYSPPVDTYQPPAYPATPQNPAQPPSVEVYPDPDINPN